jgi:hypothetical protein
MIAEGRNRSVQSVPLFGGLKTVIAANCDCKDPRSGSAQAFDAPMGCRKLSQEENTRGARGDIAAPG